LGNRAGAEEAWAKAKAVCTEEEQRWLEEDIAKARAGLDLQLEKKSP
jgi:hypothetical protein